MMAKQLQISAVVSITLHILVLIIFAGVRIYTDRNIANSMPVTFVTVQKEKPLRRSPVVRPMISPGETPQRHSPEQYTVHPERRSSVEFYVSIDTQVFSAARSVGQEVFHDAGLQRPAVELRGHLSGPTVSEIPEDSRLSETRMPSRISGGHELLSDAAPAPAKPDMDVTGDVFQSFARAVRRKIESSKNYPTAAQTAGIEGRTGVRMTILKDGRLEKVEITESSGYEILDKAALQSVRSAAPFPPIPEKARRDEIQMSITLVFRIT